MRTVNLIIFVLNIILSSMSQLLSRVVLTTVLTFTDLLCSWEPLFGCCLLCSFINCAKTAGRPDWPVKGRDVTVSDQLHSHISQCISQLPNLFGGTPRICNCILFLIVWVRSFSKRLPSVTFAEEKVLIFSERELKFMFAICRRPSVCLSSVCNVRAPYSGDWYFRQYFYAIL